MSEGVDPAPRPNFKQSTTLEDGGSGETEETMWTTAVPDYNEDPNGQIRPGRPAEAYEPGYANVPDNLYTEVYLRNEKAGITNVEAGVWLLIAHRTFSDPRDVARKGPGWAILTIPKIAEFVGIPEEEAREAINTLLDKELIEESNGGHRTKWTPPKRKPRWGKKGGPRLRRV